MPVFYSHRPNENPVRNQGHSYYYVILALTFVAVVFSVASVWIFLHCRHKRYLACNAEQRSSLKCGGDTNTDISLLQDTDKDIDGSCQNGALSQYTSTPTRELNVSDLMGAAAAGTSTCPASGTNVAKTPVVFQRRTILFSSSNESFQSEKDGKITPYATFGPVDTKGEDTDEETPLKETLCARNHEGITTAYANVHRANDDDGYMLPRQQDVRTGQRDTNEECDPLMV